MNAPVFKTKYPPVPLVSLLTSVPLLTLSSSLSMSLSYCFSLPTLKPHHGLSRPAQDKFCLHQDGGGGRRAWTKGAFIAVCSGWLRTDNGHILQFLKQIAVCSLPCSGGQRAVEVGELGFRGQASAGEGKSQLLPEVALSHVEGAKIKQQRQR